MNKLENVIIIDNRVNEIKIVNTRQAYLYVKNGFVLDKIIKPDYRYTRTQNEYINKYSFKKEFLHKKYDFPLTIPISEMLKNIGYYKIWDCGRFLYRWEENNETSYTEFNKKR